jgi:hypothetical protein
MITVGSANASELAATSRGALADETNEASCAQGSDYLGELHGIENQHVQQMPDTHKIVVAFHGVPAIGETVFVLVGKGSEDRMSPRRKRGERTSIQSNWIKARRRQSDLHQISSKFHALLRVR